MIFTGFLPNATKQDLRKALGFLLLPWKWVLLRKGKNIIAVENWLKKYFDVNYAYTFDSGRTALQKAIEACGVQSSDEVLVQAYTCIVVSNAIVWSGAKPVYVDVGDDYNMNPEDLQKKITDRSKVLIIQHTFGTPADIEKLVAIAKKHNLKIIEDCAHALGVKHNGVLTGTVGDIGMFSFGTDKVVSSMRGGALITSDEKLGQKIYALQQELPLPTINKTIAHLFSYVAFAIGKPLYDIKIGRYILGACKKLNLIGRIIYDNEKKGKQVSFYPATFANPFASILLDQLNDLDSVNIRRQKIAGAYNTSITNKAIGKPAWTDESIYLRYTLQVKNPLHMMREAKKHGILLGLWYDTVIAPSDCNLCVSGYREHSCPHAEQLAAHSINLPTNRFITKEALKKIVTFVNNYAYTRDS